MTDPFPAQQQDDGTRRLAFGLAAAVIGTAYAVLILGPRPLNPVDLDWMKGDPVEHYLGWLFYAQTEHTTFPLTWSERLGYPVGSYISLTDPALPVFLGWWRHVIPQGWQFFGWLFAFHAALTWYWGYRLAFLLTGGNRTNALLGSFLFLLVVHFARSGPGNYCGAIQWPIVAALYHLLAEPWGGHRYRRIVPFCLLIALASAFHPYIGAIVLLIALSAILRWTVERSIPVAGAVVLACVSIATLALTLYSVGILSVGSGGGAGGYEDYSLNLLAPFNPNGFHALAPWQFPLLPAQEDIYAYLGLGIFLLIGATAVGYRRLARRWSRGTTAAVLVLTCGCLVIALSNKVTLGSHVVFHYELPWPLSFAADAFRVSERFFWPVHMLIIGFCVGGVSRAWPGRVSTILLTTALLLQAVDLSDLRRELRDYVEKPATGSLHDHQWDRGWPWTSAAWTTLGRNHRHLVVLPAWQCDNQATPGGMLGYVIFGRLAADQHLTINEYRASRYAPGALDTHCREIPDQVRRGRLEPDTAYVLSDELFLALTAAGGTGTHRCGRSDGYILCRDGRSPADADSSEERSSR